MFEFLAYRPVIIDDAQLLLTWRTAPHVARYMLSQIENDVSKQRQWINQCAQRSDYAHRIIQIQGRDVGFCSITVKDADEGVGELGVYIGEIDTPRELSIYNFLGTLNHAFYVMGLKKIVNRIIENNPRTLKLQAFNGYQPAGVLPGQADKDGQSMDVHLFELTRERWHEFRLKFGHFKDWDGNLT